MLVCRASAAPPRAQFLVASHEQEFEFSFR
jgi:hypothetical protein